MCSYLIKYKNQYSITTVMFHTISLANITMDACYKVWLVTVLLIQAAYAQGLSKTDNSIADEDVKDTSSENPTSPKCHKYEC